MESLIKLLSDLAPFLAPYPNWVKGLFAFWVAVSAALFISLALARGPVGGGGQSSLGTAMKGWLAESEKARASKTISSDAPLPTTLVHARGAFETAWREASLSEKKGLDPKEVSEALSFLTRLYRVEEIDSPSHKNSLAWADVAIDFAREIQDAELLTEAQLDKAAIYLELAQLQHTDKTRFGEIARAGDALMTQAYQSASKDQQSQVLRMTSRFYYNLARPQSFRLSENWDNNYLLLAHKKATEAVSAEPADIKNANQLARSTIKVSKNPPQDQDPVWTKNLRSSKDALKAAWEKKSPELRSVSDRLSPLHVLGVVTLETAAREWVDASPEERQTIGPSLLGELETDALGPLREALALLKHSELRTAYGFDLYYDVARALSVKTSVTQALDPNQAEAFLEEVVQNLSSAKEMAKTSQLQASLQDIGREITFSFLTDEQRGRLVSVMSVQGQ